jgi:hypothetical protein
MVFSDSVSRRGNKRARKGLKSKPSAKKLVGRKEARKAALKRHIVAEQYRSALCLSESNKLEGPYTLMYCSVYTDDDGVTHYYGYNHAKMSYYDVKVVRNIIVSFCGRTIHSENHSHGLYVGCECYAAPHTYLYTKDYCLHINHQ